MHCASLQSRLGKGLCPRSAVSLPAAAPATLRRHKPAACAALVLPPLSLQRGRHRGDLPALVHQLGLEQAVLNQPWVELSVRCCLPACLALRLPTCVPPCTHGWALAPAGMCQVC